MKCEMADDLIQNYLDRSLSHEQRIQLEKHVELCSRCREELQSYKQLMGLFELEEPCPDLPADFTQRIMRSLPDISFQSSQIGTLGSVPTYLKTIGMGLAAIFVVGIFQMDISFWNSSIQDGPAITLRANPGQHSGESIQLSGQDGPQSSIPFQGQHSTRFQMSLRVNGGVVHVRNSDGFHLIRDGEEHSLSFRDEIRTGAKASASIVYPQGNVQLRLKPRTRVQIARNSLRLFHGDTWVNIVKKGTRFEVKTPNLIAAVRGTIFTVGVEGDPESTASRGSLETRSQVSVFEGKVEVRSLTSDQPSVFLTASRQVWSKGLGLEKITEIDDRTRDKWSEEIQASGALIKEGVPAMDTLPGNSEVRPEQSISEELGR